MINRTKSINIEGFCPDCGVSRMSSFPYSSHLALVTCGFASCHTSYDFIVAKGKEYVLFVNGAQKPINSAGGDSVLSKQQVVTNKLATVSAPAVMKVVN